MSLTRDLVYLGTIAHCRGNELSRALIAGTLYFVALFTVGFALGTMRVIFVAPHIGPLAATFAEVPVMLAAAYLTCRWVIRRWQLPGAAAIRWAMVLVFLALLASFEALLGATLFARTISEQWAAVTTPAGLLGLFAQIVAAILPVFVDRGEQR